MEGTRDETHGRVQLYVDPTCVSRAWPDWGTVLCCWIAKRQSRWPLSTCCRLIRCNCQYLQLSAIEIWTLLLPLPAVCCCKCDYCLLQKVWTLDLSSSRVRETLGHTSTLAFSVDSELLHYFPVPGHADAFDVLLYGVYLVISWSSRLSLWTAYIPVYSLSWQSVIVYSQNMSEPSQSSLFYDEIYLLHLCLRPDSLATDSLLLSKVWTDISLWLQY